MPRLNSLIKKRVTAFSSLLIRIKSEPVTKNTDRRQDFPSNNGGALVHVYLYKNVYECTTIIKMKIRCLLLFF